MILRCPLNGFKTLLVRPSTPTRSAVFLRAKESTVNAFGLAAIVPPDLKPTPKGYVITRRHAFVFYRIAVPDRYEGSRRCVGWSFGISQAHTQEHMRLLAQVIEASGAEWIGFQDRNGGHLIPKQHYLQKTPALIAV